MPHGADEEGRNHLSPKNDEGDHKKSGHGVFLVLGTIFGAMFRRISYPPGW
jgi:hypothetical protein